MGSCSSTPETPPKLQDRHWNPRLYHGNDSYLQRYVAVSRTYHEGLITLIESEGCDAAHFLSPALFPYNSETTKQALRGTPFYTIYKHIVALGLTPQVYLEPQIDDNNNLLVCSMGTYEDIDWISLLLSDHDKFVRITRYSDVTLHNFGRMMVIAPQLFKYRDHGSMSSMVGQCGSASNLQITQKGKDATRFACLKVPDNPIPGTLPGPASTIV